MNCILYARVSTDRQAQKDLSIPAQIAAMKEYARINNWKVIDNFVDEGESARTANRPELRRLLQYCKEHKEVDVVIVHKLDRLARNLVDYGTIKAIFKQKGVRLVSVSESFDEGASGQLMENIFASISEWYSANLGEEIKKAARMKLSRGEWPHKPPIGYISVRDAEKHVKHVPDPVTVPLIQQAFELFATGSYSLATLSEEMHCRGLATRSGRMLTRELMKNILQRQFYISNLEWQGKIYKGSHDSIISTDLFYRVQEVLKKRSRDTGEKGRLRFLLRGTAYCNICGRRLTGEIHPRGSYYRCIPDFHGTKCKQPYTPVKFLDDQLEELYANLQPPKKLLELLKMEMETIANRRRKTTGKEITRLTKTLEEVEMKELRLLDEKITGILDRNVYEKMQATYTEQKSQAKARLAQVQVDYDDPLDFLDKCITVASSLLFLHQRFGYDEQKNLLKAVFEKIEVEDKGIVAVKLTPPFSLLLGNDIQRMFEDRLTVPTKQDIFEHITEFAFSEQYAVITRLTQLLEKIREVIN